MKKKMKIVLIISCLLMTATLLTCLCACNKTGKFDENKNISIVTRTDGSGTGLGLSIVKHVEELYGAKLTLSSTLGAGTEITVSFKKITKTRKNKRKPRDFAWFSCF